MDLKDALRRLEAAKGDPNALALATIDIVLASHEPGLTLALEAAAVPHWFDEPTLRALLGDAIPDANDWFDQLIRLTVVERFHAHGAWNVHEVTRLVLGNRLAEAQPDRFRALSRRAASLLEGDAWPQVIERVYHRLSYEPDQGADELRRLSKAWMRAGMRQPLQALGKSLDELCSRDLLSPRVRAHALVALGEIRAERIDLGARAKMARESVALMTEVGDEIGLIDAYLLLGKVLRDESRLGDALAAYEDARANLELRVGVRSDDGELADERADVHEGVGRTLQERGKLREALGEFEAAMDIRQRLCEGEPENDEKRRGLAIAYADVGDALLPTSRSGEAESHFLRALNLFKLLHTQGSGQEPIEEDSGRIHVRLGVVLNAQGKVDRALEQFEIAEDVFRRLTKEDPEHLVWKHEAAQVHIAIGGIHLIRGQLDGADHRFKTAREIYADLVERDPVNPTWKDSLGSLISLVAVLRKAQGKLGDAVKEHLEAERLLRELSEADPDRAAWKLSLATAQNGFGSLLKDAVDASEDDEATAKFLVMMVERFRGARDTLAALVEQDPGNTEWQNSFAWSERLCASALETSANRLEAGLKIDVSPGHLLESALNAYGSSAAIYRTLAAQAPDHTEFMRGFRTSTTGAGRILERFGRRDEALKVYRAALTAMQELSRHDATNTTWAGDVEFFAGAIARLEGRSAGLEH